MDKVIRDKLKLVLKEYRTRKSNEELATDQLRLIGEVLELKSDFFRDKTRIRQGAKLNRKLETDVQLLQDKVWEVFIGSGSDTLHHWYLFHRKNCFSYICLCHSILFFNIKHKRAEVGILVSFFISTLLVSWDRDSERHEIVIYVDIANLIEIM